MEQWLRNEWTLIYEVRQAAAQAQTERKLMKRIERSEMSESIDVVQRMQLAAQRFVNSIHSICIT